MSTSLAYITQEPDPHVPLLSDAVLVDSQTQVQREVQANHHIYNLLTKRVHSQ